MTYKTSEKRSIQFNPTYKQALEIAMTTRRGSLLKAAPLPNADDQVPRNIPGLCDQIEYMNELIAG